MAAARRVSGYHPVPVIDHDAEGPQPWLATNDLLDHFTELTLWQQ
ncbi:hypothetical protein ACFVRD_07560 [Streptomyces sp. NPDC057908]